jgi:hypothetical protein
VAARTSPKPRPGTFGTAADLAGRMVVWAGAACLPGSMQLLHADLAQLLRGRPG